MNDGGRLQVGRTTTLAQAAGAAVAVLRDDQLFLAVPPCGERPVCPRMTAPPRSEQRRGRRRRRLPPPVRVPLLRPVAAPRTLAPRPLRPLPRRRAPPRTARLHCRETARPARPHVRPDATSDDFHEALIYVGAGLLLDQLGQHVDERLSRRARFDRGGGLLDGADERASRPVRRSRRALRHAPARLAVGLGCAEQAR